MKFKKLNKIAAYLIYLVIAKHLPVSYSKVSFASKKIRYFCVKGFIDRIGKNVNIERGASFPPSIKIGDNSGIGVNCSLYGPVIIGKNVMMAPEVNIFTKNHKFDRIDIPMCEQGNTDDYPVIIEDDVWIGSRVTILPGITIHKGAIVASCSVVTKDVEAFSIVAGNPAKQVKSRLDDE